MKELVEKISQIELRIAAQMGAFRLFALFRREHALGLWDVLACAPWIDQDQAAGLRLIANELQDNLTTAELVQLSHVAIIEQGHPGLEEIVSTVQVEHGLVELRNCTFFEKEIERAIFITSRHTEVSAGTEAC